LRWWVGVPIFAPDLHFSVVSEFTTGYEPIIKSVKMTYHKQQFW